MRGAAQSEADERYVSELRRLCVDDPRIRFMEPYPPENTSEIMSRYDALVVPSLWMETGPLVVLEAFAAGVPVLASRRGYAGAHRRRRERLVSGAGGRRGLGAHAPRRSHGHRTAGQPAAYDTPSAGDSGCL
ncbi:MAG: glycosyltransferase [Candidatus Eisenbacteria bacterium]|nr:glycosyltransferase [Candidatus Eisenbacteria bacterium]